VLTYDRPVAGRIRDEDIALVRERSAIEDVVGERVALRSAGGGNLKGLCPFHDEKSPSFNVTPARGFFHCLAGETRVLTWEGSRPIRDLAGGTHRVLGRRGDWLDAPFRSYGVQRLLRIVLGRNGGTKELYATDEHRWFARGGGSGYFREVLTKDLRPGDRLAATFPRSRIRRTTPCPSGVGHGFPLGDGSRGGSGSPARLDPVKDVRVREGFPGRPPSAVYRIQLPGDATEEFFPLDEARFRFASGTGTLARTGWTVQAVERTDREEEVFCAEVADGHAFVLEDNILTGNCFGCGVGGDVISFVQRADGLSFAEAVERLADRVGVQLRYEQGGSSPVRPQGQRTRLAEANKLAAEFYAQQLAGPEARPARDFLTSRGFDAAAAARFGCGFAPSTWDALTSHLLGRGFTQAELVTAGLARQSSRGSLIDRFHRRLLWPIRDVSGDVVGFGARRLFDDDPVEAKYLNTPDTPLYHKSQVLYGADLAKKEIGRRRQAVVVEGYTDVMACHLAGVPTAVATCGTAFGAEHIGVLRRLLLDSDEFAGEMVFVFDGDEAGQRAALRAFTEDQRFVMSTFVAVEESGLDPCDLRLSKGDTAVRDLVARRQPAVAFALRALLRDYDLETAEGRVRALERAAPLVARIKDRALRPEYARRLAGELGMEVEPVLARVVELSDPAGPRERRATRPRPRPDDPAVAVEREVLKLAVQVPQLAGPVFDAIEESAFTEPTYAAIRRAMAGAGGAATAKAGPEWVDRIGEFCPDLLIRSTLTELAVERPRTAGRPDERYVAAQLYSLQELAVSRQIKGLRSKLQRVNPLEQPDEHTRLFGELVALEQYGRGLREQALGSQ
jgi:DNA primase